MGGQDTFTGARRPLAAAYARRSRSNCAPSDALSSPLAAATATRTRGRSRGCSVGAEAAGFASQHTRTNE